MSALYLTAVALHILAAMVWVGGMLFLALVVVPALRQPELQPQRARFLEVTGIAFRRVGWGALAVLVVTGVFNLLYRWTSWDDVTSGAFWQTPAGTVMAWKLVLVVAMVAIHSVHDFWLGPRATRAMQRGDAAAAQLRRWSSLVGRAVALLSIAIVLLAIIFVRGW